MKAIIRRATLLAGTVLTAGLVAAPQALEAQARRQGPVEGASRFMVVPFRAADRGLGVKTAEELRDRISGEIPARQVYVIPGQDVKTTLEASGFSADTAPNAITARLLAQQLRAEEYLEGTVTRREDGTHVINARMVMTADNKMIQPLPAAEGRRLGDAAGQVAKSLNGARRQLQDLRGCTSALARNEHETAITRARAAIASYPQSTLARVCLANAMVNAQQPGAEVIRVAEEALAIEPNLQPALAILAQAYKDSQQEEKAVETWTRLLALDPSNVRLQTQVVNELAASGNARAAVPIIRQAIEANPGDPELARLNWLIMLAARDYQGAITAGEELVRTDTAAADTTFYSRLAVAYASAERPQEAAQAAARGIAKFPNNASLLSLQSQLLRTLGQNQQAVEAARRSVEIDPKVERGWLRLAQAQIDLGQIDESFQSLRQAVQHGEEREIVGQIMVVAGNQAYKAATASRARADYERAITLLRQADETAPSPQSKFLLGVSAFSLGDLLVRENAQRRNCNDARTAQEAFITAQLALPAGGSFQPDATKQLLGALGQYLPAVEDQVKRFCR